jgi:hypothetical protein
MSEYTYLACALMLSFAKERFRIAVAGLNFFFFNNFKANLVLVQEAASPNAEKMDSINTNFLKKYFAFTSLWFVANIQCNAYSIPFKDYAMSLL